MTRQDALKAKVGDTVFVKGYAYRIGEVLRSGKTPPYFNLVAVGVPGKVERLGVNYRTCRLHKR